MKRLLKIFLAKISCNFYCLWQMLRYYRVIHEFNAYNRNGKIIFIAAGEDKLSFFRTGKMSIEKVFYKEIQGELNGQSITPA